jgi:hypothetical protein
MAPFEFLETSPLESVEELVELAIEKDVLNL